MKKLLVCPVIILLFSLMNVASAQQPNELHFRVTDFWYVEIDGDSVENQAYTARRQLNGDICRGWENTESFDPYVFLVMDPGNLTVTNAWNVVANGSVYTKGWEKIQGDDCINGNIGFDIEEEQTSPFMLRRKVNNIFFNETGTQTMILEMAALRPVVDIELNVELRPTEYADVRIVSQSRENVDEFREGSFRVRNPQLGKLYTFMIELEITPKKGQVSYVPQIWTGATIEESGGSSVTGKEASITTETGTVSMKSSEDAFIRIEQGKRFSANLNGLATTSKISYAVVDTTAPAGQNDTPWENSSIILLVAVVAVVAAVFSLMIAMKKVSLPKKPKSDKELLAELEKEETAIRNTKKSTQREYLKGLMSEDDFKKITTDYETKLMAVIAKKSELREKMKKAAVA